MISFAAAWAVLLPPAIFLLILQARHVRRLRAQVNEGALFRNMINQVRDVAVTMHDMTDGGRVIFANDAACLHFGVSRDTLLTWRPPNWNPTIGNADIAALYRKLKHGDSDTLETVHRIASGELVPVEVMLLCQMHEGAAVTVAYTRDIRARRAEEARRLAYERTEGCAHDIAERKRLEALLQRREHSYRTLVENLPDPLFRYDTECRRTYVSPAVERITGKAAADLLGKTPADAPLATGVQNERLLADIRAVLASGTPVVSEIEYHAPDGRLRHFQNHFGPEFDAHGAVTGVLSIMRDITELKRLETLMRKREEEFRALVENSPDIISRYDLDCRRIYTNPRGVASLGGDLARILGTTPADLPGGEPGARYLEAIGDVIAQGKERSIELEWRMGGPETCLHVRICPEFDVSGRVSHVLAIGRDISEIDEYRRVIHRQAFNDALTGLPNRTLLTDRIRQAIADAAYHGRQFGLMMLDLDHFKEINDTMGHGAGDELLRMAAQRLLASVRPYDTVARLGGDEFSVLLPNMRKGDGLATMAGNILRELAEPFVMDGQELFISCSIGIALYPDDSTGIEALYKYADSAMYHAKQMGRNNFQFYQPEFTQRSQDRLELEAALRRAQKRGELALHYQPQVELQTGRMVSAEALLRWRRDGYGLVPPDRFIPAAEACGLIVDIGEWVLRTACRDVVRWNQGLAIPVRVAVNLSTRQFVRNDLAGSIRRILAETGCRPEWLELEITESLLLEDSREVAATLETLHGMGLSISIDDFGTGYSALSYLSRFPVGQLKIDRSFVQGVPVQRDKCELVKAMLSIAAALRLETVAEGVETEEQAAYLMAHGCRLAQGYLFGKPMPLAGFSAMLAAEDIPAA